MLHQPIFSTKEIQNKLNHFSLRNIPLLEEKIKKLEDWQKAIRSGRISQTNEEALQADFLNMLFGEVLEYEYKDSYEWNLDKESKTISDSTKSDGALGFFSLVGNKIKKDVQVVIELKDARSDLDKPQNRKSDKRTPVEQAFGYASKVGGNCRWVVVSNFIELRLYHHSDQTRYELFDLTRAAEGTELTRLFYFLHKDRLIAQHSESVIDLLYKERQAAEKSITKRFYSDYKEARVNLFKHLRDQNPGADELSIFNKTQKLLDRIVFVCFCEDKAIVPPYTFRGLLKSVKENRFDRTEDKIYKSVKGLFAAIDEGYPQAGINRFNGGLFAPDAVLDNLQIKDSTLEYIISLEQYDFDSELNVNILGHIFEQSISDIEELKAQITGETFDEKKGKRKKDGIFYTPEYITRYIVKEAVGGWLEDRKKELGFDELPVLSPDDYASVAIKKGGVLTYNKKIEKNLKAWETYREKLVNIKVLDPACGSGAFLNQVFDYLYAEGQRVNAELAKLRGGQYEAFDLDKHILTQNIFGVDLNPESVEITKLSLWLKTANKYKELTTLDENIKCGNSLIDDFAVAGDKAFVWEKEFAGVMAGGGFDVVVGNPPYVRQELLGSINKQFYIKKFKQVSNGTADLYVYFYELALTKLNSNGYLGFITPNKFIKSNYGKELRSYLSRFNILQIIDFGELPVFNDAATFPSIIIIKNSNIKNDAIFAQIKRLEFADLETELQANRILIPSKSFIGHSWVLGAELEGLLLNKLNSTGVTLKAYVNGQIRRGILTGFNEAFIIDEATKEKLITEDSKAADIIKPFLNGDDVRKYKFEYQKIYIILTKIGIDINNYKSVFNHLKQYQSQLEKRWDKGNYWWELRACDYYEYFVQPKITYPDIALESRFTIDYENYYTNATLFIIPKNDKYLLSILNSKLAWYYFKKVCPVIGDEAKRGRLRLKTVYIEQLPVFPATLEQQQSFINASDIMLTKNKELQELKNKFQHLLQSEFDIKKPSTKLQQWHLLAWPDLQKELEKAKVKLSLPQKAEWMEYFNGQKEKAQAIQKVITQTDKEIDQMVYKLYELTAEEIGIVEGK